MEPDNTTPPQVPDQNSPQMTDQTPPPSVDGPQDQPAAPVFDAVPEQSVTPPVEPSQAPEVPVVPPSDVQEPVTTPQDEVPVPPVAPPVEQPVVPQLMPDPTPQTPELPVEQPAAAPVTPQPQGENPGMTMGIISLVLTIVGIGLVGLILGIIALKKSKKAGFGNVPALISIILNIITVVIVRPLLALLVFLSYNGIQDRAQDVASQTAMNNNQASQTAAVNKIREIEAYTNQFGKYPKNSSELETAHISQSGTSAAFSTSPLKTAPRDAYTLTYYSCGEDGVKLGYWDYVNNHEAYRYSMNVNKASVCTFAG